MSRLLTTLLLYRCGFYVGKYISLEAKIAKNKDLYYDALNQSQDGWHDGADDPVPFIKYQLGTILAAYKDFTHRPIHEISHRNCAVDASNLGENPNCIFLCFHVCYIEKKRGRFV